MSLKARAMMLLARREHSRQELRAKLLLLAQAQQRAAAAPAGPACTSDEAFGPAAGVTADAASEPTAFSRTSSRTQAQPCAEACVDALLTWLEAHGYLSEQRFIEGRVRTRAHRYGNFRIRQELAQHGLTLDAEADRQLRDSEVERARETWARKFPQPPQDMTERARQMRFLLNRGFSSETIRRVLKGAGPADPGASDGLPDAD